jgi:hypothetical protein
MTGPDHCQRTRVSSGTLRACPLRGRASWRSCSMRGRLMSATVPTGRTTWRTSGRPETVSPRVRLTSGNGGVFGWRTSGQAHPALVSCQYRLL